MNLNKIMLLSLMASVSVYSQSVEAQRIPASKEASYRYFVGSTLLMLGNFVPDDPNRPDFAQLNVG
ncbi:MAG TPA: hypothetical protein PKW28_17060, partial [Turneriella sp.]|nr:hypothetical protein [Turneriella sp.]